jgi:hypothetical protein
VKLAKEYFHDFNRCRCKAKLSKERTTKLTAKVKALFNEYRNSRIDQNKKDSMKSEDSIRSIASELKRLEKVAVHEFTFGYIMLNFIELKKVLWI